LAFDKHNNDVFSELKLKSLINETEKNEHYWVDLAETLGVYKEKLEKSGEPVYDRIQDLLNMAVQQAHVYEALITELHIIKHGRSRI
tara:strand:- start:52 stop:312 length:261 start_codon:yes stop_codon:yes gene_type:complete